MSRIVVVLLVSDLVLMESCTWLMRQMEYLRWMLTQVNFVLQNVQHYYRKYASKRNSMKRNDDDADAIINACIEIVSQFLK